MATNWYFTSEDLNKVRPGGPDAVTAARYRKELAEFVHKLGAELKVYCSLVPAPALLGTWRRCSAFIKLSLWYPGSSW